MPRKKLFIGLVSILIGSLLVLGIYLFSTRKLDLFDTSTDLPTQKTFEVSSTSKEYDLKLVDEALLHQFLDEMGFWEHSSFLLPNGQRVEGNITSLKVQYSSEPIAYNPEDWLGTRIGSIDGSFDNGVLTLSIQSDPLVWSQIDRDWHIEAQLLRYVNQIADPEHQQDYGDLFRKYDDQNHFFKLVEK